MKIRLVKRDPSRPPTGYYRWGKNSFYTLHLFRGWCVVFIRPLRGSEVLR
jgi:hypothetical protein